MNKSKLEFWFLNVDIFLYSVIARTTEDENVY